MKVVNLMSTEPSEHEPTDPLVLAPCPILGSLRDTCSIEIIDIELADV